MELILVIVAADANLLETQVSVPFGQLAFRNATLYYLLQRRQSLAIRFEIINAKTAILWSFLAISFSILVVHFSFCFQLVCLQAIYMKRSIMFS